MQWNHPWERDRRPGSPLVLVLRFLLGAVDDGVGRSRGGGGGLATVAVADVPLLDRGWRRRRGGAQPPATHLPPRESGQRHPAPVLMRSVRVQGRGSFVRLVHKRLCGLTKRQLLRPWPVCPAEPSFKVILQRVW